MLKKDVYNPRYPHRVRILRRRASWESNNPLTRQEDDDVEMVVYDGCGRSFTDTTTDGDKQVDRNKRKASIPMRFDKWGEDADFDCPLDGDTAGLPVFLYPMDGDVIEVCMGGIMEYGRVKDFEPDNDRSIVYWEFVRN